MKHIRPYLYHLAILAIAAAGSIVPAAAAPVAAAQLNDVTFDMDALVAQAEENDSLRQARIDSLLTRASESYKQVVFMKSDGEDYADIFPALYDCYEANIAAIKETEPQSSGWIQCRETLLNINPDLEAGAFFYSKNNDTDELGRFAQAYIDTQLMPEMKGAKFNRNEQAFPTIVYIAASRAYNKQEFERAIDYFKLYFSTGAEAQRENVYLFMGQACINSKNYDLAITTMRDAIRPFPHNTQFMRMGLQACIDGGHGESMQDFLTPALNHEPNDMTLLELQGKLYEDENLYRRALETYNRLEQLAPNKLSTVKRQALCYYNIATTHFNDAVNAQDDKVAKKHRRQAKEYFAAALQKIDEVLATDPTAMKYLKMQAICNLCLENKTGFEEANRSIMALGGDALSDAFAMAPVMSYNDSNAKNFDYDYAGGNVDMAANVPLYSEFGKKYITSALEKWTQKKEFERIDEYTARVNDKTVAAEYDRLNREAQAKYLETYGRMLRLSDLKLMPYDATNETFLIESSYGPITLHVPLKDMEAERFKSNWENMKFRNPEYFISDDKVQIASIIVQTPDNRQYKFDNDRRLEYAQHDIDIDFESILRSTKSSQQVASASVKKNDVKIQKKSDVDENIPTTGKVAKNTFALIIANEDYQNVTNVQSALHDGERFAEYCQKTLGLPASNVTLMKNATFGQMVGAMSQLKNTVNAFGGAADVILYYAGHGMPDEATKDAFLLPIDGVPTMLSTSYSLDKLYSELGALNSQSVCVFLDACFSGANRDGSMLHEARGVAIKAKEAAPKGNMFVLSAASGQETALPYAEKNHGLFTYYLLKKLQESKGNVTLKDLSDYVITNVKQQSNVINRKSQTPSVTTSGSMVRDWTKTKLLK